MHRPHVHMTSVQESLLKYTCKYMYKLKNSSRVPHLAIASARLPLAQMMLHLASDNGLGQDPGEENPHVD